jgi:F0F1-type ATP synthase membrane subunit b/b'
MKETNTTLMDESHINDSNISLEESTRSVLDDYSHKLLGLIQQERDKIRKQATLEAEKILADAEHKAKLAYEKAIKNAESETSSIVSNCNELASKLSQEADRVSRIMTVLKEKTERQIVDLSVQIHNDVKEITESLQRTDKALSEIKANLDSEFSESTSIINDLKQRFQKIQAPRIEKEIPNETAISPNLTVIREDKNLKIPRKEERNITKPGDKTFVGTLNIEAHKNSLALSRRFKESLSKVPGLEISMTDDSAKDKVKIVAFASRPIPLLNILQQMSLVKSAFEEDNNIQVVLQDADRWIG